MFLQVNKKNELLNTKNPLTPNLGKTYQRNTPKFFLSSTVFLSPTQHKSACAMQEGGASTGEGGASTGASTVA